MEEISQSLDVSESLNKGKEGEQMVNEDNSESEKKEDTKEDKPVEKKKASKSASKKKKPAKKKEDDFDDFDDDFDDESGVGIYLFWAFVIVVVFLIALWIFTDWQICMQF